MALLVRIDVDRPYGRSPLWRHLASRVSSDLGLPTVEATAPWLIEHSKRQDVVLLVHPENVLADPRLTTDFLQIVESCETRT